MSISFRVFGTPKAQPRPRAFARVINGVARARVFDNASAESWKSEIAIAAGEHRPETPIEGPLAVDVTVLFARPKYLLKPKCPNGRIPHTIKPDRDNCDKAVLDCLKLLGFMVDDTQVCDGGVRKFYVARNERPGAEITIRPLNESANHETLYHTEALCHGQR